MRSSRRAEQHQIMHPGQRRCICAPRVHVHASMRGRRESGVNIKNRGEQRIWLVLVFCSMATRLEGTAAKPTQPLFIMRLLCTPRRERERERSLAVKDVDVVSSEVFICITGLAPTPRARRTLRCPPVVADAGVFIRRAQGRGDARRRSRRRGTRITHRVCRPARAGARRRRTAGRRIRVRGAA